jgi:hypothetical protein
LNRYATPVARRAIRLEPDALVVAAMKRSKLSDLGTESISEPFEILCRALRDEAQLHALGRFAARSMLVGILTTRAKAIQLVTAHPEIEATALAPPIIIMGMPRTGTTFLQRLLSRDATLRHLPYWEANAPMPSGSPLDRDAPTADRIRTSERSVAFLDRAAPGMRSIHEVDPMEADEEIWLLGVDFASMLFESMWHVPAFAEWYDEADLTNGYRWLRRMLAILQWYRPADRWLLKSPQHLERLAELSATFPGAVLVQTHRDPVKVVTSTASMITYGRRMGTSAIAPSQIGRYWAWRTHRMLERNLRQRDRTDTPQILDVRFDELMADPMAVVRTIYARAGRELTDVAGAAMERYLAERPRGHFGVHDYQPADFGIDPDAVRRDFEEYTSRFGVPTEP